MNPNDDERSKRQKVDHPSIEQQLEFERIRAQQAIADLVIARDALRDLKDMLAQKMRYDNSWEHLQRAKQEAEGMKVRLQQRDDQIALLQAELMEAKEALDRTLNGDHVAMVLSKSLKEHGVQVANEDTLQMVCKSAASTLAKPPSLSLNIAERLADEMVRNVKIKPAPCIVLSSDDGDLGSSVGRNLGVSVCAVVVDENGNVEQERPNVLDGCMVCKVDAADGKAHFSNLKFVSALERKEKKRGVKFALRFTLCRIKRDLDTDQLLQYPVYPLVCVDSTPVAVHSHTSQLSTSKSKMTTAKKA